MVNMVTITHGYSGRYGNYKFNIWLLQLVVNNLINFELYTKFEDYVN